MADQNQQLFSIARFPFRIRMAEQVAYCVAQEIESNVQFGREMGTPVPTDQTRPLPTLLELRELEHTEYSSVCRFYFEGGTELRVHLIGGRYGDLQMEGWSVTHVVTRYYRLDPVGYHRINPDHKKHEETWGGAKLLELKKLRWWHHPHVWEDNHMISILDVRGYTALDIVEDSDQDDRALAYFPYKGIYEGAREEALAAAEAKRAEILKLRLAEFDDSCEDEDF